MHTALSTNWCTWDRHSWHFSAKPTITLIVKSTISIILCNFSCFSSLINECRDTKSSPTGTFPSILSFSVEIYQTCSCWFPLQLYEAPQTRFLRLPMSNSCAAWLLWDIFLIILGLLWSPTVSGNEFDLPPAIQTKLLFCFNLISFIIRPL